MTWTIISTDSSGYWFMLMRQSDGLTIEVEVTNAPFLSNADIIASLTATLTSYGSKGGPSLLNQTITV